ncbi:MAG: bifunctional DNA primase/polymerase, partial [Hyphomicrobiaceae bacterium]
MTPNPSTALDAALRYADHGWPVFPCSADKKPLTEQGFLDASVDPEQIDRWWRRWPSAHIGVATGIAHLCV